MQKLQNNAVLKTCYGCDSLDTKGGCLEKYCKELGWNNRRYFNPDVIDKDCPLADVEIIDDIDKTTLRYWKDGELILINKDEINKIIIVKKVVK